MTERTKPTIRDRLTALLEPHVRAYVLRDLVSLIVREVYDSAPDADAGHSCACPTVDAEDCLVLRAGRGRGVTGKCKCPCHSRISDAAAVRAGESHCPHAAPDCAVCCNNERVQALLAKECVLNVTLERIAELERRIKRALAMATDTSPIGRILRGEQP